MLEGSENGLSEEEEETESADDDGDGGDDDDGLVGGKEKKKKKRGGAEGYGSSSAAVKSEIRRLARKFKEVDEWALEIEEVTPHSGSSQMVDAR